MMLRFWIVSFTLVVASFGADVDFAIEKSCYSEDENMKLIAVYTGSGTVTAVQWYYSNQSAGNLVVLRNTCDTPVAVPAGYPDRSRMLFDCDVATNTYNLTLSNIQEDELSQSWGATFSLSVGLSPDVEEKQLTVCLVATTTSTSPTTTRIMPTTTSTTPTTTSAMPTTTITVPSTTITTTSTMPTTTISITATSTASDGKLAVIIVSSVVGGLLFVGIAIAALCFFHQQENKKHNARNQLGSDHHKQYKTSKSPYQQNNDYYLYNGRSQVKENPLNRVSKERSLSRSYYTGSSSRYDNYRPAYTMEHVYLSDTGGHRFMSEYIDEKRNPKKPKHSSYPGYSMGNMRYTDNKVLYY